MFKKMRKILRIILISIIALTVLVGVFFATHRAPKVKIQDDNTTKVIAIYGDTRSQHTKHWAVVDQISKVNPDAVIHTGDMISNGDQLLHWGIYSFIENKLWKKSEYFPTRGNHEHNEWLYKFFFTLPESRTYYSFDRMGIHFIVLDVQWHTKPMYKEAEQMEWLMADLEANKGKPKIVAMHAPMQTTGKYEPFYKEGLHELFLENDVIATVSAHVHSYERSIKDGINFIVTAGGGAPMYQQTRDSEYSVIRKPFYHFVKLTREDNDTYRFVAIDMHGKEFDNFTTSVRNLNKSVLQ